MENTLKVTMLGSFSIRRGDACLDDHSNRMRKVWLLLGYLIYARYTRSTQEKFLTVVQGADSTEVEDPAGRLKALFYRARNLLDQLDSQAGRELIQRKNGIYGWNTEIPLELDVEQFDALCTAAVREEDKDRKLSLYRQALPLYQGDFLPKLSMEPWVMPINAYYHQMYLRAAEEALELLAGENAWEESRELCARALRVEPYSETLYQYRMRSCMGLGDRDGAIRAYEEMSELLFDTFGVMPSEESRQLYRTASRQSSEQPVSITDVEQQLQEAEGANGAILCEYDFFRFLYRFQARTIVRTGEEVHIALLSVHPKEEEALPRRSLDRVMENLQELLLRSLRRGDAICKCSVSQMIVMLPRANFQDSGMVCQRLIKAFNRQYPHSPAQIRYRVQPIK